MFKRENFSGKKFCPGGRYFQSKQAEPLFNDLRDKALPVAEKNATFQQSSSFIRSAGQWIFNTSIYSSNFDQFNSSNINMDYLLQMIISNDTNPWTEFVNLPLLNQKIAEKSKVSKIRVFYFTSFRCLPRIVNSYMRDLLLHRLDVKLKSKI
jgi:hypothetical protein